MSWLFIADRLYLFEKERQVKMKVTRQISRRSFLKMGMAGLLSIPFISCNSNELLRSKPNLVVIFADDVGLGDIGFYHKQRTGKTPVIPTPNIDKMISDGIRFNDAHAPNSLCAPSRFSMLTGNYSFRNESPFGVWLPWKDPGIEPKYTTSARIAKQGGYATAFFGKWGCGGQLKEKDTGKSIDRESIKAEDYIQLYKSANYFGFDYALELPRGIQGGPFAFYENSKWMPLEESSKLEWVGSEQHRLSEVKKDYYGAIGDSNWDPTQVGPILASKAVKYIKKQTADNPNQPFFMYYCTQAVHKPHAPPKELDGIPIAGSTPQFQGDMVHELDVQIGMIIKCLKETGVYKNTLLILTSDNGGLSPTPALAKAGHDSSNGLRGFKGRIYEGGDRVPFIAVWPNSIKPATESNEPIVAHDIVATMAAITEQKLSKDVVKDSLNLLPLFFGNPKAKGHEVILQQSLHGPHYAIRKNEWKLILLAPDKKNVKDLKPIALFDLQNNPFEDKKYNQIDNEQYQRVVIELLEEYLELRETGKATVIN
ncbi:MAG: arylsulfatase [Anaerolineae bacterium]|nr:arylsulfatase [Anaerolineae bacterium]